MLKYSFTLLPWLVLVALFSLVPQTPRVPGISEDIVAIAGHFFVYGVLAGLIYGLHMRIWSGSDRRPLDSAFVAAGISGSIGLLFEWSQQLSASRGFDFVGESDSSCEREPNCSPKDVVRRRSRHLIARSKFVPGRWQMQGHLT